MKLENELLICSMCWQPLNSWSQPKPAEVETEVSKYIWVLSSLTEVWFGKKSCPTIPVQFEGLIDLIPRLFLSPSLRVCVWCFHPQNVDFSSARSGSLNLNIPNTRWCRCESKDIRGLGIGKSSLVTSKTLNQPFYWTKKKKQILITTKLTV